MAASTLAATRRISFPLLDDVVVLADAAMKAGRPQRIVPQLVERADGSVWLGAEDAIQLRAPDGRTLERIIAGDGRGFETGSALQQLELGPDGALWVATRSGLLMWNEGERRFEPVPGGPDWHVFAFGFGAGSGVSTRRQALASAPAPRMPRHLRRPSNGWRSGRRRPLAGRCP